jgi:hypothetical protein
VTGINLPVRLSVDDPHYDADLGRRLEVLFNGVPRTEVVSFDIEARTLTRLATDVQGNFIVDLENECFKLETLTGDVAVRFRPQP